MTLWVPLNMLIKNCVALTVWIGHDVHYDET